MTKVSFAAFLAGLTLVGRVLAVDMEVPKEIPDTPFDIRAGRLEYTNETLIASGGVTGQFENVTLTADRLSCNTESGEMHLDDHIHFERGNVVWNGSSLDYNYLTQTGNFGPSSLDFDPVLMSVDRIERVSTNEYLLRGATFTTCAKDRPHYRVKVKEARLLNEKYLKAKGATFYLGNVPVLYVPFWRQTLSSSIFTFRLGYSSEWGGYGLVRATVPLTPEISAISDINLYSQRGVGLGQGLAWDSESTTGEVGAFFLHDQDPFNKYVLPDIGRDRYRFKLEQLYRFSDTQYVNTKWNYLSDPVILKEFFRSEYHQYAQPENYASWVYGNAVLGTEAFANYRLNDFYDNTDRVEYSADLYRTRIAGTPFYFQSENSIACLNQVFADTNLLDNVDSVRLDSANTVFLPQRYGFVSVVPRAGYRATYYSTNPLDKGDEYRGIAGAGMEVSMQATKVLSNRERWYGKGLRHKIEPYFDYIYADSSSETNRVYRFDTIDTLMDEENVKIGLRNVLQTKRNNRVSRFIDVDLYTHYLIEDNGTSDNFDSLFVDARMPLTQRTTLDVDGEVDWNEGVVPFFYTRYSYRKSRELIVSMEHLYREMQNQSLWSPRVDLYPEGRYSMFGYARYDDRTNDIEDIAIGGYMNWCCMRYGLGYHFYDQNEHSIMFSIGLSAFPEASISSGF